LGAPRGCRIEAAAMLRALGVPAAALMSSVDLVRNDPHLRERGFWDAHEKGVLPGLPWRASFGRATGPAPGLGRRHRRGAARRARSSAGEDRSVRAIRVL
jgi:crotonobetainyl-CoA:carnitine CoA-transferase CaiB-like acyl-CoA transferase